MSYADIVFKKNCEEILNHGYSDEKLDVRPVWEDGVKAHTVKKFCIVSGFSFRNCFTAPIISQINIASKKTNFVPF